MFEQLTVESPAESTPLHDELEKLFAVQPWTTDVPEVTDPWPTIEDPPPTSIRDAIRMLSGRQDVTQFLATINQSPPCERCGMSGCTDKWCDLRGDDVDDQHRGSAERPE